MKTQPHADPALLNTVPGSASHVADDSAKVGVVSNDFKEHPATYTSENRPEPAGYDEPLPSGDKRHKAEKKASRAYREAEAEGAYIWETAKHYLFRPGVAGGLVGLVNVGIIAGVGHAFYTQPHLRRDKTIIGSTVAGALALLSVEGFAAEKYRQTPAGQDEERRAKEEGAVIYRHAREVVFRPGVLGGLVGLINTAVLGAVGYYSYINWDKPSWDRRTVSAVSVGLITLWGGEGIIAERYRESRH
ncbi:hypothetical protein HWV62_44081 [Athelia sp. TMB]|nr:hypothetical protein HWV62_44081 [Athelia sp. TMB]